MKYKAIHYFVNKYCMVSIMRVLWVGIQQLETEMKDKRFRRPNGQPAYLAVSFRFPPDTKAMMKQLSAHYEVSDALLVRTLIEERHARVIK